MKITNAGLYTCTISSIINQPLTNKHFDRAKEILVYNFGYPKELLDIEYDHSFWVRGLIIDTQRGNSQN